MMSKIGKKPIQLPENVNVIEREKNKFEIKGPKGTLFFELAPEFKLERENHFLKIVPLVDLEKNRRVKALYGTMRALLNNKILGVSQGFEKVLILEGLGYTGEVKGDKIYFKIGYAHPVEVDIPQDLQVEIKQEKGRNLIYVRGLDKEKVGQFAAFLRKIKPADRYHAKGFRYFDEVIKLKPVKKAVK